MTEDTWVYVIARISDGKYSSPVKVGISRDPKKRLRQIQTSSPFEVRAAWLFACPQRDIAKAIERSFHETQVEHLAHGEWFNLEPVTAIHLLCLAFRAHLSMFVDDLNVIRASLEMIGVVAAEKKFGLHVPRGTGMH